MGTYQHFFWNYSYKELPDILVFNNHFRPSLIVFAVVYKLLPYGETLLIIQSLSLSIGIFPLYAYAKDILGDKKAVKVVFLYCLFSPVWFINLSDFHPDSFIIPLSLFAFYFLRGRQLRLFVLSIILLLTIKEITFFIVAMIGIYVALKYRLYALGYSLFFIMSISGIFIVDTVIPNFGGKTAIESTGISWLGDSMFSLITNIFLKLKEVVSILINPWKAIYVFMLFGSFLFIPLLSPFELIPAIPGIALALLSDLWRHYALVYQYPSAVVPFVFLAFIEGIRKTAKIKIRIDILKAVTIVFMLINFLFFGFFLIYKNDSYHITRYIITQRDKEIRTAIKKYVPDDISISVSASNLINHAHLANRIDYLEFPIGVIRPFEGSKWADFVVIDLRRINELKDMIMSRNQVSQKEKEGFKLLELAIGRSFILYNTVFEYDGFYIMKK